MKNSSLPPKNILLPRKVLFSIYSWILLPVANILLFFIRFFSPKLKAVYQFQKQAPQIPLNFQNGFWIHAASGEFEYAKPLLRELAACYPNIPRIVTYTSPSYQKQVAKDPFVSLALPLPWDSFRNMQNFLKLLRPRSLFISRTDLWPNCLRATAQIQCPILLFSFSRSRISWGQRLWLWWVEPFLSGVDCASDEDFSNLKASKIFSDTKISVSGDTRYDQVFHRINNPRPIKTGLAPQIRDAVLILGSTWPEDEAVVIPCFPELIRTGTRIVLVPHEVESSHLQKIEDQLKNLKVNFQKYSEANIWTSPVLLVDQVGILAELYNWASVAFVGGSFKQKVHSVMEPLACGLPCITGPFIQNNREALEFQKICVGDLFCVQVAANSDDFAKRVASTLKKTNSAVREEIQNKVRSRSGTTRRLIHNFEQSEPSVFSNVGSLATPPSFK